MRLYRFPQSPFARFVQASLDLARIEHEVVDVPFKDREELAAVTGGYIQVPVLVTDAGVVLRDSRHITETLAAEDARVGALVPAPDAAVIWAYVDWVQSAFEDVAFRLAAPVSARKYDTAFERALYVFVKERKYGPGCVDAWERDADAIFARVLEMLAPTDRTLAARPFIAGRRPTLADAALHGQMAMLDLTVPDRVAALSPAILAWKARLESEMGPPPYGRVARAHRTRTEIERTHDEISTSPRTATLAKIVVRTATNERTTPPTATLHPDHGLAGDTWARGKRRPGMQIALMDLRVARAMAHEDDWPLAGDNLILDLDLAALAPGDRLRLGTALLEITADPHLGCRKFAARFGHDALLWVNDKRTLHLRRRGIYARVVEPGTVGVGNTVS